MTVRSAWLVECTRLTVLCSPPGRTTIFSPEGALTSLLVDIGNELMLTQGDYIKVRRVSLQRDYLYSHSQCVSS